MSVGTRMGYWVAQACRLVREEAKLSQTKVAGEVDVRETSVYRFEIGGGWPRDPERYVNAYAKTAGLSDPREIWARALELWHQHGTNPFEETGSLSGFERAIEEAAADESREAHDEPGQKSA